jgi:hypothetical protein
MILVMQRYLPLMKIYFCDVNDDNLVEIELHIADTKLGIARFALIPGPSATTADDYGDSFAMINPMIYKSKKVWSQCKN